MNNLSDEAKAQLANKVDTKLMGFHVFSLLKMMLLKSGNEKESSNKNDVIKEHSQDAKEAVAGIIDLVGPTVPTGKVPDQEAA